MGEYWEKLSLTQASSQALGEEIARSIYPETTIARPAPCFGFEDKILHKLAGAVNFITSNHMEQRFRPVHALDVGQALEVMLFNDDTIGQTYELYGPTEYAMSEIGDLVDKEIVKKRRHINIPKRILKPAAGLLNKVIWWDYLSADEVEREFIDQQIDPKAKTFADLGIQPANIQDFIYHYLVSHLFVHFHLSVIFWALADLMNLTASISKLGLLRSSAGHSKGEERGAEVLARDR